MSAPRICASPTTVAAADQATSAYTKEFLLSIGDAERRTRADTLPEQGECEQRDQRRRHRLDQQRIGRRGFPDAVVADHVVDRVAREAEQRDRLPERAHARPVVRQTPPGAARRRGGTTQGGQGRGGVRALLRGAGEGARGAARGVDERRAGGEALGPLAGVPLALKDVLTTTDMPTTCGSAILDGWRPPYDATVTARLRAAGCVFAEGEARLIGAAARTSGEALAMAEQRATGLPLEHVVGWARFCGLRVGVDPGVFVPRPRTELLVRQAAAVTPPGAMVVDLACGSGAVGLAVAADPAVPGAPVMPGVPAAGPDAREAGIAHAERAIPTTASVAQVIAAPRAVAVLRAIAVPRTAAFGLRGVFTPETLTPSRSLLSCEEIPAIRHLPAETRLSRP